MYLFLFFTKLTNYSSFYILGPSVYNVQEGRELALICKDNLRGSNDQMVWKRKVILQNLYCSFCFQNLKNRFIKYVSFDVFSYGDSNFMLMDLQGNVMPNGNAEVRGSQVIVERVQRGDEGEYQCWRGDRSGVYKTKQVNVICEYVVFYKK